MTFSLRHALSLRCTARTPEEPVDLSKTRFFGRLEERELIESYPELLKFLHDDPKEFLERLGILSEAALDNPVFRNYYEATSSRERLFYNVAFSLLFNIAPEYIAPLIESKTYPYREQLNILDDAFNTLTKKKAYCRTIKQEVKISDPPGAKNGMMLFPATFREVPDCLAQQPPGVQSGLRIFGVFLPQAEFTDLYRHHKQDIFCDKGATRLDIPGALAYIRFYELKLKGNRIYCIAAIEHQYPHVSFLSTGKYADWDRVLLSAFEQFVRKGSQAYPNTWTAICIPNRNVIKRRFDARDIQKAIGLGAYWVNRPKPSAELGRLFAALPRSLGYTQKKIPKKMIIEKDLSNIRVRVKEGELGWRKIIYNDRSWSEQSSLQAEFGRYYRAPRKTLERQLRAGKNRLFPYEFREVISTFGIQLSNPIDRSLYIAGKDHTPEIEEAFQQVPILSIVPKNPGSAVAAGIEVQKRLLSKPKYACILEAATPDTGLVSRGLSRGMPTDWWNFPRGEARSWCLAPMHVEEQERHPSLRFIRYGRRGRIERMHCVCMKGGGVRDFHNKGDDLKLPRDGSELPLYLNQVSGGPLAYWGGLSYGLGVSAYENNLKLLRILDQCVPEAVDAAPLPLDLAGVLAWPSWLGKDTRWHFSSQYQKKFLSRSRELPQFVLLRTITSSDVRISQLVNRIFNPSGQEASSIENYQEYLHKCLSFVYFTHGEKIRFPKNGIPQPEGALFASHILAYLTEIYELNKETANRILRNFALRGHTAIGALHGTGGHFGGAGNCGIGEEGIAGALGGGSTSIRNVDTFGTFHDFEDLAMIPDRYYQAPDEALYMLQWWDLAHFRDCMYWMNTILRGADIPPEQRLERFKVGKFDDRIFRFGPLDKVYNDLPDGKLKPLSSKTFALIDGRDMRTVYRESIEKGSSCFK